MAALLGVNVDRTISLTFVMGAALAAVAGMLFLMYYGVIDFFIGFLAGIKAFTAAVLGGIGSLPGAMLGGLLIGLIEVFWAGYFSSEYKDVAAFAHPGPGADLPADRPARQAGDREGLSRWAARLPAVLKDAALTALVAAGARPVHRRLPHRRHRQGADLRLPVRRSRHRHGDDLLRPARPVAGGEGLTLAGLRARRGAGRDRRVAAQAAVDLPALVRGAGRRADRRCARSGRGPTRRWPTARAFAARHGCSASAAPSGSAGPAGRRRRAAVHAVRRPEDDGSRRPDPDLRHAGLGPEHRGRPRRPARPRLRRLLRGRRLHLCAAQHPVRPELLGRCCRSPA